MCSNRSSTVGEAITDTARANGRTVGRDRKVLRMVSIWIWLPTLVLAIAAGWWDWRSRRIPNWLTVSGLFVGLAANTALSGWPGTRAALEGAGLCLALLFPLVLVRGMGAGDWKLMGALGALLGPGAVYTVLLLAVLIAGVMAIVAMVICHRVKQTLQNLCMLVVSFLTLGLRHQQGLTLDSPKALKLPFGVAAALSTIACFAVAVIRLHMRS